MSLYSRSRKQKNNNFNFLCSVSRGELHCPGSLEYSLNGIYQKLLSCTKHFILGTVYAHIQSGQHAIYSSANVISSYPSFQVPFISSTLHFKYLSFQVPFISSTLHFKYLSFQVPFISSTLHFRITFPIYRVPFKPLKCVFSSIYKIKPGHLIINYLKYLVRSATYLLIL